MSACSVSAVSTRHHSPRARKPASSTPFETQPLSNGVRDRRERHGDLHEPHSRTRHTARAGAAARRRAAAAGGGSRAGRRRARAPRARGVRAGPRGSRRSRSCAARRGCRRRRAGRRSRRIPWAASRASGGSGRGIKGGNRLGGRGSFRMMPERQVSTTVSPMYAEKRDRPASPDEKLGRWILVGVVLLAIAAGVWYLAEAREGGARGARGRAARRPRSPRSRTRSSRRTTSTRTSPRPNRSRRSSARRASRRCSCPTIS